MNLFRLKKLIKEKALLLYEVETLKVKPIRINPVFFVMYIKKWGLKYFIVFKFL